MFTLQRVHVVPAALPTCSWISPRSTRVHKMAGFCGLGPTANPSLWYLNLPRAPILLYIHCLSHFNVLTSSESFQLQNERQGDSLMRCDISKRLLFLAPYVTGYIQTQKQFWKFGAPTRLKKLQNPKRSLACCIAVWKLRNYTWLNWKYCWTHSHNLNLGSDHQEWGWIKYFDEDKHGNRCI